LTDDVTITLRIVSLIWSPRDTPLVTSTNSMTSDAKKPSLIWMAASISATPSLLQR
jgi:hypothetical protein